MNSMRLFSTRDRPVHLGPYPLERLARLDNTEGPADLSALPAMAQMCRPGVLMKGKRPSEEALLIWS